MPLDFFYGVMHKCINTNTFIPESRKPYLYYRRQTRTKSNRGVCSEYQTARVLIPNEYEKTKAGG